MCNDGYLFDYKCNRCGWVDIKTKRMFSGGKYNKWYKEAIEEPIRPVVKLLRDNGFNTFSSCGHDMSVELENYSMEEINRLYNLLMENGYEKFTIHFWWETYPMNNRILRVMMG